MTINFFGYCEDNFNGIFFQAHTKKKKKNYCSDIYKDFNFCNNPDFRALAMPTSSEYFHWI